MTTPEELEREALDVSDLLEANDEDHAAEVVRQMIVRYRAMRINANNYRKALEALEHASVRQSKKAKWEPVMATRVGWGEPKVVQAEEEWFGRMFKCSSCGTEMIGDPKYCYGCGAEMENGKDEDE